MRFRRRRRDIQSSWLVRVLAKSGEYVLCDDCGSRMFIASETGVCPVCRARRQRLEERVHDVVADLVDGAV